MILCSHLQRVQVPGGLIKGDSFGFSLVQPHFPCGISQVLVVIPYTRWASTAALIAQLPSNLLLRDCHLLLASLRGEQGSGRCARAWYEGSKGKARIQSLHPENHLDIGNWLLTAQNKGPSVIVTCRSEEQSPSLQSFRRPSSVRHCESWPTRPP